MTEEIVKLFTCSKCGELLIRVNEVKEGHRVDCKWMCINPVCRKDMNFPVYYGYTQEDINGQA
jgi:formylmethanofuran dehydrogenase subunit E